MKQITVLSIFFCLLFMTIKAQSVVSCTITDCKTKEPIPYVHVGIAGKNTGTITNEQGLFTLNIPDSLKLESLTISSIGYETQRLAINMIKTQLKLCPSNIQLSEVVIRPKKEKTLGLSRKSYSMVGVGGAFQGGELAGRIKNDGKFFARKIGLNVTINNNDTLKFRLAFYKANGENIGEVLNTKPVYWQIVNKETGWLYFDLPQDIVMDGDFFVGFEIVTVRPLVKKSILFIGCAMTRKTLAFLRPVSQANWQPNDGCHMNLTVIGNY